MYCETLHIESAYKNAIVALELSFVSHIKL